MDALILSCGTGGGHNSAAAAVKEEMLRRGHRVQLFNPYDLSSENLSHKIDMAYINVAKNTPRLFGAVYQLGNLYRRLPWRSPVYRLNVGMADRMYGYLQTHHTDVIITTHIFPAQILTYLREHGCLIPRTIMIATDYTCIPFFEECNCDAYVIPSKKLTDEFAGRGVPRERIYPLGIPVKRAFRSSETRDEAKRALHLDPSRRYILISGGSMGAGSMIKAADLLMAQLKYRPDFRLCVICGTNTQLREELEQRYGDKILLMGKTDKMALWLRACDIYMTKPGGLSTTEAAVSGSFLCLLPGIPGCETCNTAFFKKAGMCRELKLTENGVRRILASADNESFLDRMKQRQRQYIPADAAEKICDLAFELFFNESLCSDENIAQMQASPELAGISLL